MSFAQISVELKIRVVGFLVGLAHMVAGIAVWQEPASLNVTALATLRNIADALGAGTEFAAGFLFVAGVMAVAGSANGHSRVTRALLFTPQQLLLLLQVVAIYMVFTAGQYPDGYIPVGRGWFILTDQFLIWLCALSHSIWLAGLIFLGGANGRATGTT